MAEDAKKLYCSRDGMIGGVCAGIARYFDLDAGVVRLVAVVIAILTCGIGLVAYAVAWMVMPMEPDRAHALNVEAQSAASDRYGAGGDEGDGGETLAHGRSSVLAAGICGGVALATILSVVFISRTTHAFSFEQLWPLLVMGAGFARIVVPSHGGYTVGWVSFGIAVVAIGMVLLAQSLGLLTFLPQPIFEQMWPFAMLVAGFTLLGHALDSPVFLLVASLLVVLACVVIVLCYAVPGPVDSVWVPLPQDYGFYLDLR